MSKHKIPNWFSCNFGPQAGTSYKRLRPRWVCLGIHFQKFPHLHAATAVGRLLALLAMPWNHNTDLRKTHSCIHPIAVSSGVSKGGELSETQALWCPQYQTFTLETSGYSMQDLIHVSLIYLQWVNSSKCHLHKCCQNFMSFCFLVSLMVAGGNQVLQGKYNSQGLRYFQKARLGKL